VRKKPIIKAIEKEQGTVYRLDYRDRGKRYRLDFPLKYEAAAEADRLWSEHLKARQRPSGSAAGIDEWIGEYEVILRNDGKKEITISRYMSEIKRFVSWLRDNFGKVNTLDDLTTDMGNKYLEYLRTERSYKTGRVLTDGTRWLILKVIKSFLKAARENVPPKMYEDPFKPIKGKKPKGQTGTRELKNEEVAKIKDQEGIIRDISVFSLYTGLRLKEVITLKRISINLEQNTIDLLGKQDKRRIVPIHREAANIINRYKGDSETLFVNPDTGDMFKNSLGKRVKKFLGFMEITDKASHHSFRKTFATEVEYKSKDRLATEILLGHRDEDYITGRYLFANLERLRKAIDSITFE
jgi:integrase/recombinase XerD